MKIVHIITTLGYGGAEKICMDLCNEMADNNHEVYLLSLFDHTPDQRPLSTLHKGVKFVSAGKKPGLDLFTLFRVRKLLKAIAPDIVNTHLTGLFFSFLFITLNGRSSRTKFFHTVHNLAKEDVHPFFNFFNKYLLKRSNVTAIALSKEIRQTIIEYYNIKDVPVIFNAVPIPMLSPHWQSVKQEIESYKSNSATKILINLARIHPQKNQEMLINVCNRLEDKNVVLLIVGNCTDKNADFLKRLKKLARANVHFLGVKNNAIDYLYHADVFCLSSLFEGVPISLLEALALGKMTICTPVGGIPSVITHKLNGLLSTTASEEDFHEAVLDYLSLPATAISQIQEHGIKTFQQHFTISVCAQRYLELYRS